MATVHDVAAYILRKTGRQSSWKLQHLLYYSQAWHLAWEGQPLFPERIEAWPPGPCVPDAWQRRGGQFAHDSWPTGNPRQLTAAERETVDLVVSTYAKLDGSQLTHLVRAESPWRDAREGLDSLELSSSVIAIGVMREFYSALDASEDAVAVEDMTWDGWDLTVMDN